MDNKRILDKIEKLLAMSKSSSAHEAAIALERISKLMQEYNISQDDINLSAIEIVEFKLPSFLRYKNTMILVASTITKAFGVKAILSGFNSKKCKIEFYGNKDRVALIKYTLEQLLRQLSIEIQKETDTYHLQIKKHAQNLFLDLFKNKDDIRSQIKFLEEHINDYDPYNYAFLIFDTLTPLLESNNDLYINNYILSIVSKYKNLTNNHLKSFVLGWLDTARSKIVEFAISKAEKDLLIEYTQKVLSKQYNLTDTKARTTKMTQDQYSSYLAGKKNAQKSFNIKNAINGKDTERKLSFKD